MRNQPIYNSPRSWLEQMAKQIRLAAKHYFPLYNLELPSKERLHEFGVI
jgi:hypothetical protein